MLRSCDVATPNQWTTPTTHKDLWLVAQRLLSPRAQAPKYDMVARPSRARAKPRSLYDEQAEELRKKGVQLQTQDDDDENEEQDDDLSLIHI